MEIIILGLIYNSFTNCKFAKTDDDLYKYSNNELYKIKYLYLRDLTDSSPVTILKKKSIQDLVPMLKILFLEISTSQYSYYAFGFKIDDPYQTYIIQGYNYCLVYLIKMAGTWTRYNINTTIQN